MIEVLLTSLQEFFHLVKTPITDELTSAISVVQTKSDPIKAHDIKRTFLADSRVNFASHIFKLNDRVQALENERKVLQTRLKSQHDRSETVTPQKARDQETEPDSDNGLLQQENEALKARIKEVRLVFNKQVNDLQETLKNTRASMENEMTALKVKYAKDL
jgi:hypothetical protein